MVQRVLTIESNGKYNFRSYASKLSEGLDQMTLLHSLLLSKDSAVGVPLVDLWPRDKTSFPCLFLLLI